MATIKEWDEFFNIQAKEGRLDKTIEALNNLPRFIYSEFEGLENVRGIAIVVKKHFKM